MPDASIGTAEVFEILENAKPEKSQKNGFIGRQLFSFFGVSKKNQLPPYAETLLGRCFIVALAIWAALVGAYYFDPSLMPQQAWAGTLLLGSATSFFIAGRLRWNQPRLSVWMQAASTLLILVSLVHIGRLELIPAGWAWAPAILALVPAIHLSLQRNLEWFAILGFALALAAPLINGLSVSNLYFSYCLLLCLPLPLILCLRDWRCLNVAVFGAVLAAGLYFLTLVQSASSLVYATWASAFFWLVYFLAVLARVSKQSFMVLDARDFLFTVALAAGGILCQLRIAYLSTGSMVKAAFALALALSIFGIFSRLLSKEQGATLSRVYFLMGLILLNVNLCLLLPATLALALYCLEAMVLFGLGSSKAWPRAKAGGFIILLLTPIFFFFTEQRILIGTTAIGFSFIICAYIQDRELKRLARRSGKMPWSSSLEFWFVAFGFVWCFGGLLLFTFRNIPSPGLVFFALSSASAYLFYSIGKLARLRSLRVAIFLPMLVSIPAILLPFIYQSRVEWPMLAHLVSYNYLTGIGALAWLSYFVTVWTALYHNWGGLISNRNHARLLGLITLELVLVLTSSLRAFALESGVSPSFLSVLAVLPSVICVLVLSRIFKTKKVENPYCTPLFQVVPWLLFIAVGFWFLSALSIPGSAAPGGRYVPLLNPVELVQIFALGVFGYWQRRLRKSQKPTVHLGEGAIMWVYAIFSFLWLHGVMLRVVQYFSQAQLADVLGFVEIRIIFACIWATYGIIIWIGATHFASTVSWMVAVCLIAAGILTLVAQSFGLWGSFVAIALSVTSLAILALLLWRSPAPFTQRGRKLAEQGY